MNPVIDTIMIVLFVLFMIYIFRGYHLSKYDERESDIPKGEEDDKQ